MAQAIDMAYTGESYKYQPFPNAHTIRLVTRSADTGLDSWAYDMKFADIDNVPEYVAVSYCWGDVNHLVPFTCDDGTIMVPQSASQFLEAVCRRPALFWIDSVCINQQDIPERNGQVAMMADIFGKASSVMVWLGPDPYEDGLLFRSFWDLVDRIADIHSKGGRIEYLQKDSVDLYWTLPDGESVVTALPSSVVSPSKSEAERLSIFFNLPWFSRSWVMQEVGLAASTMVVWGRRATYWNAIGLIALFLVRHAKAMLDTLGLTDAVEGVCHVYTAFSPFKPLDSFLDLLNKSRRMKATDPRDKVFAFLSHPTACTMGINAQVPRNIDAYGGYFELVTQFLPRIQEQGMVMHLRGKAANINTLSSSENKLVPLIKADYHKSVAEVYRDVTREHIRRTNTLEILTVVQHDSDATVDLPFPSWVPQWDKFDGVQILGIVGGLTGSYNASGDRTAVVTLPADTDSDTLIVRGILVSKIVYTSPLCQSTSFDLPLRPDDNMTYSTNAVADTWLKFKLHDLRAHGKDNPRVLQPATSDDVVVFDPEFDILKAYMRTWVAEKDLSEADGFDREKDTNAYWHCLWANPTQATRENPEDQLMHAERYRSAAATIAHRRKLFVVSKGLFGLGPGAMRNGDWVAILLGPNVPFVIREVDGENRAFGDSFADDARFQLVGECYVNELMTGAAVKGVEVTRDIVLV